MKLLKTSGVLTMITALAISFQSCSSSRSTQTEVEHAEDSHTHAVGEAPHSHAEEAAGAGFVTVRDHKFKLAPDIGKDNVAHLDFYLQNAQGKFVPGADITLNLTAPDGEKRTYKLTEEEGGEHYHNKTTLEKAGTYQAVAQVTINGEKYNPRFTFERP